MRAGICYNTAQFPSDTHDPCLASEGEMWYVFLSVYLGSDLFVILVIAELFCTPSCVAEPSHGVIELKPHVSLICIGWYHVISSACIWWSDIASKYSFKGELLFSYPVWEQCIFCLLLFLDQCWTQPYQVKALCAESLFNENCHCL